MNQVKREISLGKWPTTLSWLPQTPRYTAAMAYRSKALVFSRSVNRTSWWAGVHTAWQTWYPRAHRRSVLTSLQYYTTWCTCNWHWFECGRDQHNTWHQNCAVSAAWIVISLFQFGFKGLSQQRLSGFKMPRSLVHSIYKRMGLAQRMGTNSRPPVPNSLFIECKEVYRMQREVFTSSCWKNQCFQFSIWVGS